MNKNLIAALQARFELAVQAEVLEEGEIEIAQRALGVLLERYEDTVDAIESAILLDKLDADNEPDELSEDEANAALDEQSTWPQDEFGREIDPGLKR